MEVVEKLAASIWKVKLPVISNKKKGASKDSAKEELKWLTEFFERPDITRHHQERRIMYTQKESMGKKILTETLLIMNTKRSS